jgi:hypothetical protein
MEAVATWQNSSSVLFEGWKRCAPNNRGIRIVVEDVGPRQGPHTKGLGSQIDSLENGMSLNFSFKNWSTSCAEGEESRQICIRAIAVHEFGHALGFAHEQNRDDTPDWCKLKQKPQGSDGDVIVTPWDPTSVMNYCYNIYKDNLELSKFDIYALQLYYGKPRTPGQRP